MVLATIIGKVRGEDGYSSLFAGKNSEAKVTFKALRSDDKVAVEYESIFLLDSISGEVKRNRLKLPVVKKTAKKAVSKTI